MLKGILIVGLILPCCFTIEIPKEYQYEDNLSGDSRFNLKWSIIGDEIIFKVTAETKGWAGIAFWPPNLEDDGLDGFVGWVDKYGIGHVTDIYGPTRDEPPIVDDLHNWVILESSQVDKVTMFVVTRALTSTDWKQDIPITNMTEVLEWATANEDPADETVTPPVHDYVNRGEKRLFLIPSA